MAKNKCGMGRRNAERNKRSCDEISTNEETVELADVCPICLDELGSTNRSVTPCGHKFCMTCITRHLYVNGGCPICRREIQIKRPRYMMSDNEITNMVVNEVYLFPVTQILKDVMASMQIEWSNIPISRRNILRAMMNEHVIGFGVNMANTVNFHVDDMNQVV